MVTDPARVRRTDAGNPDVCNVFALHKTFSAPEAVQEINAGCRSAAIGCVDCKQRLADSMNNGLAGLRERRAALAARPDDVWDVLRDGAQRARALAAATMDEVRAAIGLP